MISAHTRALLGYVAIPRLRTLLAAGVVGEADPVERAMMRFARRGRVYTVITTDTPLELLEAFFEGAAEKGGGKGEGERGGKDGETAEDEAEGKDAGKGDAKGDGEGARRGQDFAVVTDGRRRFVLGVVTRADLDEFVRRRAA